MVQLHLQSVIWITDGLVAVFDSFALIGGFIYGAIYAPLVITGMHHTFLAVDLQLIGSTGATFLWPIFALSNIAQGSAAFAMMLATKDEKLKGFRNIRDFCMARYYGTGNVRSELTI